MTSALPHTSFQVPETGLLGATSSSRKGPSRLVVGCGYLGMRVAARWLADGARVFGVTRTPQRADQLAQAGIEPIVADVSVPGDLSMFSQVGDLATLFWSVGFDRVGNASHRDIHIEGFSRLLGVLSGQPRVIFSSSTGVWGDEDGKIINEQTPAQPTRENGRVLLDAENLLRGHRLGPGVVLRFAGLYGPGRLPRWADLQAGKPIPADPESWLNLIHVDDAASVVCVVASNEKGSTSKSLETLGPGQHFLPRPLYVVSDGVPLRRREWYGHLAMLAKSPLPTWDPIAPRTRGADKRIDPSLLFRDYAIPLAYPDSLQGLTAILRQ